MFVRDPHQLEADRVDQRAPARLDDVVGHADRATSSSGGRTTRSARAPWRPCPCRSRAPAPCSRSGARRRSADRAASRHLRRQTCSALNGPWPVAVAACTPSRPRRITVGGRVRNASAPSNASSLRTDRRRRSACRAAGPRGRAARTCLRRPRARSLRTPSA